MGFKFCEFPRLCPSCRGNTIEVQDVMNMLIEAWSCRGLGVYIVLFGREQLPPRNLHLPSPPPSLAPSCHTCS